ncbi:MAG: inositol monophosphatase family protein, partial [Pirellulaceae bacterium]|nr:inositol monophosphatase family protein [Pirellulaceae bacterium]
HPNPQSYVATCQLVAQLGGQELMRHRAAFETREKGPKDLVTDADFASQRAIHDALHATHPEHHFLGEEDIALPMVRNQNSEFTWIVDPLDGTLNYVHGLQSFSVSVALRYQGRIIAAAVFDPWLNEMYSADENSPATLNGQPIHASDCCDLTKALAVVSLPPAIDEESAELKDFLSLLFATRSFRRLGSAALNLCYLAAGRLDLYWATTLKSWDIAGGQLILQQAGGCLSDVEGNQLDLEQPRMLAAATPELAEQAIGLLRKNQTT